MKELTVDAVKPNDFGKSCCLIGSPFRNSEKETVARNIIALSQLNNNVWLSFTWEEYKAKCKHEPTDAEKKVLDFLVEDGFLNIEDEVYSVQNKFIATLSKFIR